MDTAHAGDRLQRLEERRAAVESRTAPQRLADGFVGAVSVEPLLRSVVHARDPLQREQAGQAERDLPIEPVRIRRILEANPLLDVVVVEKRDEEPRRVAVRAQDVPLDVLAVLVHLCQRQRAGEALDHRGQHGPQRKIERRVDADELAGIARLPSDEPGDRLLAVEDLAEREEVLLGRLERGFAHRVAEQARKIALQELEGVDPEPVDVVARHDVLVRANQETLRVPVIGAQLAERREVADGFVPARQSLTTEQCILLQLGGPDERVA